MPTVQLTTNPGFEDLALDELRSRVAVGAVELRPDGLAGHLLVEVDTPWDALRPALLELRSVHRAVRRLARFPLDPTDPLGGIRAAIARLTPEIAELDAVERSFRVTSSRTGTHPFTSEDVQREAGAGVRSVRRHPVSMKAFDVELRCDVRDDVCCVGVQLGGLSRGQAGPHHQRTSLRPNVAWCLLQLARPDRPPTALLDPFCGAGTILVEAGKRWPGVRLAGGDLHEEATAGARHNLAAAGVVADLRTGDARALAGSWPEGGFDTVVCNPPFGLRLGRGLDLVPFYAAVLRSLAEVTTPDARLVMLVYRREAFNRAIRSGTGWRVDAARIVELGGVYVGAFTLAKTHRTVATREPLRFGRSP